MVGDQPPLPELLSPDPLSCGLSRPEVARDRLVVPSLFMGALSSCCRKSGASPMPTGPALKGGTWQAWLWLPENSLCFCISSHP